MNKPHEPPRRALGKGLNALLPGRTAAAAPVPLAAPQLSHDDNITRLPIDLIDPNPVQPRRVFQAEPLEQLAQSLRQHGVIQPLVVRRQGQRFQLVAGERRWRAAKLAQLREVPAVVQDVTDDRLLEITLIENVQREDLNAIELALAFERMANELNLSHEEIGQRTSKDRSTVANAIRLLQLPSDLQQLVAEKRLSAGHARCLLTLPDEEMRRRVAEKVVAQGLSVRQLERLTKRMTEARTATDVEDALDPNVKAAIEQMERALGTKVRLVEKAGQRGRIEIEYYSSDDLDRIFSVIVKESAAQ